MAYIINRYNGQELTILEDGTINSTTSLNLIGRNYFGYGEQQNENFLFLLENFSNNEPPLRPISGQLWFDTTKKSFSVYNGEAWISTTVAVSSTEPPPNAAEGTLWVNSSTGVLNVKNNNQWSLIGPETVEGFGTTRAVSTFLIDTSTNRRPVILFKVNNVTVAIASSDGFTIQPPSPIPGFSTLVSGITVSSLSKIRSDVDGIATRAKALEVARAINGVPFDGQNDITVRAHTPNRLLPGLYISGDFFDGSTLETWNIEASIDIQPNKLVARNNQGDIEARVITATLNGNVSISSGTSNFNIVSANQYTGGSLLGNSDTATKLETARKINGVSFDGTADITVPADATTLTGPFINSQVIASNLKQVGVLDFLFVSDAGISVGNSSQKIKIISNNQDRSIYSETGSLKLGGSDNPELTILNVESAVSQGVPLGQSAIVPSISSNIGTPTKKWNGVYANNIYSPTINPNTINGTVTVNGNFEVTGDFTVQGVITTVNSTDVVIEDKLITLAAGSQNEEQADGAGIEIEGSGASLFYTSLGDKWNINKSLDAGVNDFITSGLFQGTATSARYADLAENYLADRSYEWGTVLEFGGKYELTVAEENSSRVAGVVSKNPAYLMNSECTGEHVVSLALQGRVLCKVKGIIKQGDMMVSAGDGYARADNDPKLGTVIGKSLENFQGEAGIIEIVVGRI